MRHSNTLTATSMTPKGRGMMGIVVPEQLEGQSLKTYDLQQGYAISEPPAVAELQVP